MSAPLIAVTMGDAAGIGPEIIVKAFADPAFASSHRAVVVGDAARLRLAAEICDVELTVRPIPDPERACFMPGAIDVIDCGGVPPDLQFGVMSPEAGEAAYQFIRVAASLAVDGRVDAICTAPLNKEALHAAGRRYPGHTELLAALTGVDEVSMMLCSGRLRVIHVTTHIGLMDAIERIDPQLVLRTIVRGHDALLAAGFEHPSIAVCGINPHAGENGLFGRGEDETNVAPAVEEARRRGIDARGPLPADTAFFLAGRGDYHLVVAMYHDQGHAPVKVLGLDAGVNITVGLPVIRTSVDHGTAFDIAGRGIAEEESFREAMRQCARLAARHPGPGDGVVVDSRA